MKPTRSIQFVALALCAVLIFAASRLSTPINKGRTDLNMFGTESVMENAPPEYATVIQALGAFRGLITNIAFMRAENYKEMGRYYDAVQLGTWICNLQPRFPSVWEFVSWNMAWNISVTTHTPQERWNWVYNGAKLLRDKGVKFNPRALNLYKQIAWIFNNKMGEMVDDYHITYKANWAWRMHLLLGPPPNAEEVVEEDNEVEPIGLIANPLQSSVIRSSEIQDEMRRAEAEENGWGYVDRQRLSEDELEALDETPETFESQAAKRAMHDYLVEIAAAPESLDELYEESPGAREMIRKLRDIGVDISDAELTEDEYWSQEEGLAWTFFQRYRKIVDPPSILLSVLAADRSSDQLPDVEETDPLIPEFDEILGISAGNETGMAIVRFVQRKVLDEVYKLDLQHMIFVVDEFGALDWRSVDAQGLYWATLALIRGGETVTSFQNDRTNTARLMFFSLRNLFNRGAITFEPFPKYIHLSYLDLSPNLNFIEAMHLAYVRYGKMIDPRPEAGSDGVGSIYRIGHINFLGEAIRALYFRDRLDEAMRYFRYLANTYGRDPNGNLLDRYNVTLEEFALKNYKMSSGTYRDAVLNVGVLIREALDQLASGDIRTYNKMVKRSAKVWKSYMEDTARDINDRRKLPPFREIQLDELALKLAIPSPNPTVLLNKVMLWRNAPVDMKRWVYDDLKPYWEMETARAGFDLDKSFPEPPGMEKHREEFEARLKERKDETAETTVQPTRSN